MHSKFKIQNGVRLPHPELHPRFPEHQNPSVADTEAAQRQTDTIDIQLVDEKKPRVRWYRSTFYNATILGLCNFCAPGLWGAMNSLGAGGAQKPYLVNTANALTFCLMVVSCYFSSVLTKYVTIKGALIFGTIGYAPYAAGLYTNNRYGTEWLVLLGAALCGISAGVFWAAEAAIALAYPEPYNKGKGAWWIWATVLVTTFRRTQPSYDWADRGFGHTFAVFIFLTAGFQLNYLFCYFLMGQLARDESEIIRYAALLRGTESAWQAVSYGLNSIPIFASVGGVYLNFGLWAISLFPAWLVVRHFGQ